MGKTHPYMTVTVQLSTKDALHIATHVLDELFEQFEDRVFDLVGYPLDQLRKDLLTFPPFQKMVQDGIASSGTDALDEPYDHMDFYRVHGTKEWKMLSDACYQMLEILEEVEEEDASLDNDCTRAIETLKRAGFKIVKT